MGMKYSLLSLMIVVTLAPVVAAFVGRGVHLQQQAAAHDSQCAALAEKLCPIDYVEGLNTRLYLNEYRRHERLAAAYRNAAWRPWVLVQESQISN